MTLSTQLASLEAGGLILLAHLVPEIEYLFRHALVQEAAYHSLLKTQRLSLHRAVGESLERLYPGGLASPELYPVLALHFAEAGERARALHYYTLAGRLAAESYANAEAANYLAMALEMARALPAEPGNLTDLYLRRGRALEHSGQDAAAIKNYEDMEAWAMTRGDQPARLAAMTARATIYVKPSVEENQGLGHDLSFQALALARELGDRAAEAKAEWNLSQHFVAIWQMPPAIEHGERALQIARELGLAELVAYVLTDLSKAYFQFKPVGVGNAALEEARAIWRELGTLNMLSDNLASTAMMQIIMGQYAQAVVNSDEAYQISRAIGNPWNESYSRYALDMVYFEWGELSTAIEVAETCLRLAEVAGFSEGITQAQFDLALMFGYMGMLPRGLELARQVLAWAEARADRAHPTPQIEGLFAMQLLQSGQLVEAQAIYDAIPIGKDPASLKQQFVLNYIFFTIIAVELGLATGKSAASLAELDELIAYLRQMGVRLFLPDVLHLRFRVLQGIGRVDEAYAALLEARHEAESLGSRRILWIILADLAELEDGQGDAPAAEALRRQAAEIINYIAAHAGSATLADSFIQQPVAQNVLRLIKRQNQ